MNSLNSIKRIIITVIILILITVNCPVNRKNVYAALPKLTEISENDYYGKQALSGMDNGDSYVYAYEQIADGIANYDGSINLIDSRYSVSPEEIMMVFETYCNDYPQHFWRNVAIVYSYIGDRVTVVMPSYSFNRTELEQAKVKFDEEVEAVIQGIDASMSEFERELEIHDRLAARITYSEAAHAHDSSGALVDGIAVCEGYARAFQYALYKVGIENTVVSGYAGENHAWNLVKIDDQYYYTDLTWDDQHSDIFHAYFNLPLSEMSKDHELRMKIKLPTCDSIEANYFNVMGGRLSSYTIDNITEALNKNLTADIYLTCDTTDLWNWYTDNIDTIVSKLGIVGTYTYGYNSIGNEWKLTLSGNRPTVAVTDVVVNTPAHTFEGTGETCQISAEVMPGSANNKTVTYTSSNTDVAIVNKYTGNVTAVGKGNAYITAASEDGYRTARCEITVLSDFSKTAHEKGDVNGDNEIDIKDSAVLKRYLAGWKVEMDMAAADVNADGEIDIKDSALIKRYLAGWT